MGHGNLEQTHGTRNGNSLCSNYIPQSQPLVKDCQFGVSPVNYSDSDSDSDTTHGNSWNVRVMFFFSWNKRLNLGTPRKCLRVKIAFDLLLRDITIDSGDIPKEWTLANISPLFKKGDRSLACNYRPVSLTCVPCKLLEHIVCSNIMAHLDEHKLLSDRQHAFRK